MFGLFKAKRKATREVVASLKLKSKYISRKEVTKALKKGIPGITEEELNETLSILHRGGVHLRLASSEMNGFSKGDVFNIRDHSPIRSHRHCCDPVCAGCAFESNDSEEYDEFRVI